MRLPHNAIRDWWHRPVLDRLDALIATQRRTRPTEQVAVKGVTPDDVTCDQLAPQMWIGGNPTGPEFCTRRHGHGGWHRARSGKEWVDSAEHAEMRHMQT